MHSEPVVELLHQQNEDQKLALVLAEKLEAFFIGDDLVAVDRLLKEVLNKVIAELRERVCGLRLAKLRVFIGWVLHSDPFIADSVHHFLVEDAEYSDLSIKYPGNESRYIQ